MIKLAVGEVEWLSPIATLYQKVIDLDHAIDLGGSTALHDAVLDRTDMSVREVLSRCQVDVKARDHLGFTALHWAVARGRRTDVDSLLKHGVGVNAETTLESWTPLHLACKNANYDLIVRLIVSGADVNREDFRGCTPIHFVPHRDDICERLKEAGADIFHRDFSGNNALHSLARHPTLGGDEPTLSSRKPATIFQDKRLWGQTNNRGERPMQIAAMYHPDFIFSFGDKKHLTVLTAPMSMSSLSLGRNIYHFIALYWKGSDIQEFEQRFLALYRYNLAPYRYNYSEAMATTQLDPDALDDEGSTPMALLERRMFACEEHRMAGMLEPTRGDVYDLVYLLSSAQYQRWVWHADEPYIEESKQRVLDDGSARKTRLWLERERVQLYRYPPYSDERDTALHANNRAEVWKPTNSWWRDIDDNDSELSGVKIPDVMEEFA